MDREDAEKADRVLVIGKKNLTRYPLLMNRVESVNTIIPIINLYLFMLWLDWLDWGRFDHSSRR